VNPVPQSGLRRLSPATQVGLATLAGTLIRIAFLARQPIGLDEDFTAVAVHQPLGRTLDIVAHDSAPPLFYALERGVAAAFDSLGLGGLGGPGGPVALRLVPALAGIALIPLLAALARRIGGDRAAVWTALFVAFMPTTVLLSGFARMYGLGATLTVACALLLWRAVDGRAEQPSGDFTAKTSPRTRVWIAYTLCAAAAVWTDYFSIVALAGIALAALLLRPRPRVAVAVIAATGIAVLSVTPWLAYASAQLGHSGQRFWIDSLNLGLVAGTLPQIFAGPQVAAAVPFSAVLATLQAAAVVVGCAALAALGVAWRSLNRDARRAAAYCLLASSGVAMLLVASIWRPILDARYANLMWMPVFAIAGAGLARMPRALASLAVAVVAVSSLGLSTAITHSEASALIPLAEERTGPHDLVITTTSQYLILLDEGDANLRDHLHVLSIADLPWYVGTAAYPDGAVVHAVPADVVANGGRVIWIADPGEKPTGLPAGYRQIEESCVYQACLTVFAPS
jgi:4-amino-4-deoxy-L-arabinose transferase-like glycosyltransferase